MGLKSKHTWKDLGMNMLLPVDFEKEEEVKAALARKSANPPPNPPEPEEGSFLFLLFAFWISVDGWTDVVVVEGEDDEDDEDEDGEDDGEDEFDGEEGETRIQEGGVQPSFDSPFRR